MKKIAYSTIFAVIFGGLWLLGQEGKPAPMTFPIDCAGGDCPLLKGPPQTEGMRGGSARLKPGESIGWHSTAANEEVLVILHGSGVAHFEGHPDVPLAESMLAHIPSATRHNVTNNGAQTLEYVWLVAPIRSAPASSQKSETGAASEAQLAGKEFLLQRKSAPVLDTIADCDARVVFGKLSRTIREIFPEECKIKAADERSGPQP